jgi:8-oxo-dGTP pyrophosphatase MutT (NUDIX family)
MSELLASARDSLESWAPPDSCQSSLREAFLGLLAARPDAVWRSCEPGHLTGSVLITDPMATHVLLMLHRRVGLWLQMGGHCEPGDRSLQEAAAREATEESGIAGLVLDPDILQLDVHPVTCSLGVPTRHFDVQYLAVAPVDAVTRVSAESLDMRWFALDGLPDDLDASVRHLIVRARARLARWTLRSPD